MVIIELLEKHPFIIEDAHSIMVTVVGNGIDCLSSNPGCDYKHFT